MKTILPQGSLVGLWEQLASEISTAGHPEGRRYRRLDLNKENGIRVSCVFPGYVWELIVEAGKQGEAFTVDFPNWQGMKFEIITLDVPVEKSLHIRIVLEDETCKDIFATVCSDLVIGLDSCMTNSERRSELSLFLERWSRFFDRHGNAGLSQERQRGLYGELWWIRCLIGKGIAGSVAVNSWKGCERGYHDFDLMGHVVEVKTTMTKEPRKVWISNERQLDERGLVDLHLFVLTLIKAEIGGETLPGIVQSLRLCLSGAAAGKFEYSLREAGYLDMHKDLYRSCYTAHSEELFQVIQGFPRIITLPPGTGDLGYSVVLSACTAFSKDAGKYLGDLVGDLDR